MNKYNTFLTLFIVTVIAFICFMLFYLSAIFSFIGDAFMQPNANPSQMFSTIFSTQLIIALVIMLIASLANRIFGIVMIAKTRTISDGEKALWIIGFVLMSFVTSIVFLVMAKGKKFVD